MVALAASIAGAEACRSKQAVQLAAGALPNAAQVSGN